MMQQIRLMILMVAMCLTIAGCGGATFRDHQDWTQITDARLFRTCQVTEWGSGVWLAHTEGVSYVLTCAHVLEGARWVKVHIVNPKSGSYESFDAEALYVGHPHKEDLALLRLCKAPAFAEPFKTRLAFPTGEGEASRATVMNISFGAEDKPFALEFPMVPVTQKISSYLPDSAGTTEWTLTKGLMHGGITQANSGSPVFTGTALYGLVESSPFIALIDHKSSASTQPQSTLVIGVCTSIPDNVESFLRQVGMAEKCLQPNP
jgi:hypothetical protein